MYRVIVTVTWVDEKRGDHAHQNLIPIILDRREETAPTGCEASIIRASETALVFLVRVPDASSVVCNEWRQQFRNAASNVLIDHTVPGGIQFLRAKCWSTVALKHD